MIELVLVVSYPTENLVVVSGLLNFRHSDRLTECTTMKPTC
jgi:hypothetical protein